MKNVIANLVEMGHFIKQFKKKIFVIKIGGSIMGSDEGLDALINDIIFIQQLGIKIVIVHGGGPFITERLKKIGIQSEFVGGYRVTNEGSIKEIEMLLSGHIGKEVAMKFNLKGSKAVGVNGKDAGLIMAKKKNMDCGNVGEVEKINSDYLSMLLDNDYIPVISPIGFDTLGVTYNINADDVASAVCSTLSAEKLLLVTDVKGLYEVFGDEESFISTLTMEEAKDYIEKGHINGGMIPKLKSCIESLNNGAKAVHIISGKIEHSLLIEIFSNDGIGTMIV